MTRRQPSQPKLANASRAGNPAPMAGAGTMNHHVALRSRHPDGRWEFEHKPIKDNAVVSVANALKELAALGNKVLGVEPRS
jgi:hypothetical protein